MGSATRCRFLAKRDVAEFMDRDADGYFSSMTNIDLYARHMNTRKQYKEAAIASVQDFTVEEEERLTRLAKHVDVAILSFKPSAHKDDADLDSDSDSDQEIDHSVTARNHMFSVQEPFAQKLPPLPPLVKLITFAKDPDPAVARELKKTHSYVSTVNGMIDYNNISGKPEMDFQKSLENRFDKEDLNIAATSAMRKKTLAARIAYDETNERTTDIAYEAKMDSDDIEVAIANGETYGIKIERFGDGKLVDINLSRLADVQWVFAKSGYEEGLPHTRGNIIFLSDDTLKQSDARLKSILLHEKVHVYQRANRGEMERVIKNAGYVRVSQRLGSNRARNNPDIDEYIYQGPDGKMQVCRYTSDAPSSIRDVLCNPMEDHPYETMAYDVSSLILG